jgi:hypothetical protein
MSARREFRGARQIGPRTAGDKMRSRRNALRHGLAIPICHDPDFPTIVDRVAREIAGASASGTVMQLARLAAEAQLDVMRCRQARCRTVEAKQNEESNICDEILCDPFIIRYLVGKRWTQPAGSPPPSLDDLPNATLNHYRDRALSRRRRTLAEEMIAIDRYERRALSRRNRALQDLDCQRLIDGVPRP